MTEMIDGIKYVTAAEAAAELSTTETRVLMLLKRRALEGILSDQGWFITRDSLDRLDRDGAPPQLEPACRTSCTSAGCGCH